MYCIVEGDTEVENTMNSWRQSVSALHNRSSGGSRRVRQAAHHAGGDDRAAG